MALQTFLAYLLTLMFYL